MALSLWRMVPLLRLAHLMNWLRKKDISIRCSRFLNNAPLMSIGGDAEILTQTVFWKPVSASNMGVPKGRAAYPLAHDFPWKVWCVIPLMAADAGKWVECFFTSSFGGSRTGWFCLAKTLNAGFRRDKISLFACRCCLIFYDEINTLTAPEKTKGYIK